MHPRGASLLKTRLLQEENDRRGLGFGFVSLFVT